MKYVNEFALKEGTQAEYKRRHDEIWPEMKLFMKESGVKNYSIWNIGTRLIEYYEVDDIEHMRDIVAKSDVKKRWDKYMSDILVYNEEGKSTPLTLMFEFNGKDD